MARGESKEAGFTFVELMVVIFIIGLAASAVILAIPDEGGSVYSEAERFAARAKTLRDKAIIDSRPAAVRITPEGYSLFTRHGGQWKEYGRFDWVSGTAASSNGGGETRFDSTGMATPLTVTLERGRGQVAVSIDHVGSVHVRR